MQVDIQIKDLINIENIIFFTSNCLYKINNLLTRYICILFILDLSFFIHLNII